MSDPAANPCPICGWKVTVKMVPQHAWVECGNIKCGAQPAMVASDKQTAILLWNAIKYTPTEK